jgi:hypothetical protein
MVIVARSILAPPGESKLIPLASYGEAYDRDKFNCSDSFFRFVTPKGGPSPRINTLQRASIEVTGHGSSAARRTVLVWVDETGRLRAKLTNWWTLKLPFSMRRPAIYRIPPIRPQ